jgi:tight adherence protein B
MEHLFISFVIFLLIVFCFQGIAFFAKKYWDPEERMLKKQLKRLSAEAGHDIRIDIIRKKRTLSKIPQLNLVLEKIPLVHKIDFLLQQANSRQPVGVFILSSLTLAVCGIFLVFAMYGRMLAGLPVAAVLGAVPFIYIVIKKKNRMQKFERQLPEALELMAKALKAGHGFSVGMQMAAQEFDDPLGKEFELVIGEVNLGAGIDEALKNMTARVDCPDLRFFAVSVIIQKETGGNLAEILENISYLIRERFKLRSKIMALTAEARISSVVLVALPLLVASALLYLNPRYLRVLGTDPIGQVLVAAALIMMAVGIILMKCLISVKV